MTAQADACAYADARAAPPIRSCVAARTRMRATRVGRDPDPHESRLRRPAALPDPASAPTAADAGKRNAFEWSYRSVMTDSAVLKFAPAQPPARITWREPQPNRGRDLGAETPLTVNKAALRRSRRMFFTMTTRLNSALLLTLATMSRRESI
tara:strand:+ start:1845 stop:2300 length:456 start_codon:yes stop_codon:yes gene_type:complete